MGKFSPNQYISQFFPPASRFTLDNVPDLSGKVAIVTGGNTGLGYQLSLYLISKNARVYVASRNSPKTHDAIRRLKDDVKLKGKESLIRWLEVDLASLGSVRRCAEEFKRQETELHLLFNNAGVCGPPLGSKTEEGYEMVILNAFTLHDHTPNPTLRLEKTWGTNVLGHQTLLFHLTPTLVHTSSLPSNPPGTVRIIWTSSDIHMWASTEGLDFERRDMGLGVGEGKVRRTRLGLYGLSKLAAILQSRQTTKLYSASHGIWSFSLHPGSIYTEIMRNEGWLVDWIMSKVLYPTSMGVLTQLHAATSDQIKAEQSGGYLIPWARFGETMHPQAEDDELAEKVWTWCQKQVESFEGVGLVVRSGST